MKSLLQRASQRGAIFVLTALLLPLTVAMAGVTVDLGNIYYHKSILQNTSDAAALGGAHVGGDDIMRFDKFDKKSADDKAKQLIYDNKTYEIDDKATKLRYVKGKKTPDATRYYVVHLEEDVPLYFIRYFIPKTLGDFIKDGNARVTSDSYAQLAGKPSSGSAAPFTDLFIYSKHLDAVNSINNPDNYGSDGQISSTFTGRARCTSDAALKNTLYSEQTKDNNKDRQNAPYPLDRFFTKNAKGMSVNAASAQTEAQYDEATGEFDGTGYWSKAYTDTSYDLNSYWNNTIKKDFLSDKTKKYITDQNKQTFKTKDLLANKSPLIFDIGGGASRNLTVEIDSPLAKTTDDDADTPYYIIVKGGSQSWQGTDVINFNIKQDTVRPIILCLDTVDANQSAKVHFNIESGKTYRGVIYAPRISDEGILVNSAGGTFLGSIISEKITLRGDKSNFEYKPFGTSGSGGGSSGRGNGNLVKSPDIALAVDGSDVDL